MGKVCPRYEVKYSLNFHHNNAFLLPEGQLITCSYEYISEDWNTKSFVMFTLVTNYIAPITIAIFFYSQIVMAVVNHEKALREQAKKMGVDSLRSGEAVKHNNSKCQKASSKMQLVL